MSQVKHFMLVGVGGPLIHYEIFPEYEQSHEALPKFYQDVILSYNKSKILSNEDFMKARINSYGAINTFS